MNENSVLNINNFIIYFSQILSKKITGRYIFLVIVEQSFELIL